MKCEKCNTTVLGYDRIILVSNLPTYHLEVICHHCYWRKFIPKDTICRKHLPNKIWTTNEMKELTKRLKQPNYEFQQSTLF